MAIRSMTGFGRSESALSSDTSGLPSQNTAIGTVPGVGNEIAPPQSSIVISVEMKSVNNRFLDVSCKLPPVFQRAEPDLQKMIRSELRRGRVDVYVSRNEASAGGPSGGSPSPNETMFRAALVALEKGFRIAGVHDENLARLEAARHAFTLRGVMESGGRDPDVPREIELLMELATKSLSLLKGMREQEGNALSTELSEQLVRFEGLVQTLATSAAFSPQQFHDRLHERITRLLSGTECDPQRLAQEVAFLVERADVTEELTRLRSHIQQFRDTLKGDEGGKKFEFLLQEMGREINTTGAKSQSPEISQAIVEAKLVLERMREQVLNVE